MSQATPGNHGLSARGMCIALLGARFNDAIVAKLIEGARDTLLTLGANREDVVVRRVPGAFELPLAAQELATSGIYDGVVALGAVIRGGTPHFDYVCGECAAGLNRVQLDHRIPVGFGVLTCDDLAQAEARAGGALGNKGEEAALAVVEMVTLLRELRA